MPMTDPLHFAAHEREILLATRGVGPRVVERLEQMGISSLVALADADVRDLLEQGARLSGSSCWKNSPQARAAIQAAIASALACIHGVR
jgi:nucleotidyltransferase/DNA polymerase involved in DNA repair